MLVTKEKHLNYTHCTFLGKLRTENGRSLCGLCFDSPVVAFIVIDQMYFDFDNMYGMAHIDT